MTVLEPSLIEGLPHVLTEKPRNDLQTDKYEGVSKSFEPQAFSPFR